MPEFKEEQWKLNNAIKYILLLQAFTLENLNNVQNHTIFFIIPLYHIGHILRKFMSSLSLDKE